jgi:hypothetical protein
VRFKFSMLSSFTSLKLGVVGMASSSLASLVTESHRLSVGRGNTGKICSKHLNIFIAIYSKIGKQLSRENENYMDALRSSCKRGQTSCLEDNEKYYISIVL